MRIPGVQRFQHKVRQVRKRWAPKGLILMYHRVAEVEFDPWGLCVHPQHFAEHLEVLRREAHPMSLKELVQAHQNGTVVERAVAITFDDGYADNFHQATPLLEQYRIPATIFVASGLIGRNQEFWWDELERVLLRPGTLPERLCFTLDGKTYQWELGEATNYSAEAYQQDCADLLKEPCSGSRMALYYAIWEQLQPLPDRLQQQALDQIRTWAGVETFTRPLYRPLTLEELQQLGQKELVEIGAHTVTHPFLPGHVPELQRQEIQRGRAHLEEMLAQPITSFSYPFSSYNTETVDLVRELGFECACCGIQDVVWSQSDRFQLPRFAVQDWNGQEFSEQLLKWFHH